MSVRTRAVRVSEPGGELTLADIDTPDPGPGQVRVTVEACGICHSDVPIINGYLPGTPFPMTPGHEIAGRVDAVGPCVTEWAVGQRVAAGYIAGTCGHCDACRAGDGINCPEAQIPGVSYPGGFADQVVVPANGLSRIPDELRAADAAALACAGLTAFNAIRNSSARPGELVAVMGLGGVGHLGVQIADMMGFVSVAVARGPEKGELARDLGADHVIDSTREDVPEALQGLGGAKLILAAIPDAAAISAAVDGLGRRGELVVIGLPQEELSIGALQLIVGTKKVYGAISGTPLDREESFRFAVQQGLRPMIEEAPLEDAAAAYARMLSGEARFRMVLTTGN
ncbi:alcohol dehydrogenase [Streptomyces sp. DvalAA-14]|uniref:alcohol dehydrogenase catalytic domain-containing protein n=1 Tax=unclassified Streptomyces TaxID=2593676 RepID=UPI00081BC3B1|nr:MULTISPECIES: alcohol dehydrogenase catalytic domain-containing protein [unclassified Streptomyces]MYS22810.1 alcohol dehydrogenase catalytic domain-containing protein [Streptomyces sp. SID4948]SCE22725.1 alcohol dehydrogenase [Streptomyces sp. DvalAA-14]